MIIQNGYAILFGSQYITNLNSVCVSSIYCGYSYISNLNSVCVSSISCLSSIYCSSDVGIHYYSQCSNHVCRRNDNQSGALNNAKVPVLVNPDKSWVVCHIYKKKNHMPCVIAQVYNSAEGVQVPFYNLLEQENSKEESSSRTNMKANYMGVGN